ncbi:hypothetical protein [Tahibacter amnicola]|uniref:Secreted protein n=1 Tax=Tahibacter amnicola TaxID=2976241 RepID=A0ABY6BJL1_9GAMM|nr:hypothetical protein [Tahibacter amnicola]UXI69781.1 hypothetical protein N4264_09170 [Tahibacter amnicola]
MRLRGYAALAAGLVASATALWTGQRDEGVATTAGAASVPDPAGLQTGQMPPTLPRPAALTPSGPAGTAPSRQPFVATPVRVPGVAAEDAESLAQAMNGGDPRTPPLAPDRHEFRREPPTPVELADPQAYRRYESRQQAAMYAAFEREAGIALAGMQQDLQRARAMGLDPAQLAEGEDKMARLADTLDRLRRDELVPAADASETPVPVVTDTPMH